MNSTLSPFEVEMLRAGATALRAQNRTLESVNATLRSDNERLEKLIRVLRRLKWVVIVETFVLAGAFVWAVTR